MVRVKIIVWGAEKCGELYRDKAGALFFVPGKSREHVGQIEEFRYLDSGAVACLGHFSDTY